MAAKVPPAVRQEVERIRDRLRLVIHQAPMTQRQIEERAGFSKGYLSQLMCGNIDLKFHHMVTILGAAGVSISDFFGELYPERPSRLLGALASFRRRSQPLDQQVRLQLTRLYGLGLASLDDLSERLDRCEDALAELESLGIFERKESQS